MIAVVVIVLVPLTLGALIVALGPESLALRVVLAFVVVVIAVVLGLWLYLDMLFPWPGD